MSMKQLISVLVAAMFAAVSVAAIAQDKSGEKGAKAKTTQKAKAAGGKAKPAKAPKKTQKKMEGEGKKK